MSRLRKSVVPFSWNTITANFTQGTTASVNLAAFLRNPQGLTVTYSVIGSLPSGVTLSGATLSYNGAGAAGAASVQFRAVSGAFTADSAPATVQVVAVTTGNLAPIWQGSNPISLGDYTNGGTVSLIGYVSDVDGPLPLTFGRTGSANDTAPGSITLTSGGTLTIPSGLSVGTYTIEVFAEDGFGLVGQVTGLTATPSYDRVTLNWSAVSGATSYQVERLNGATWALLSSPTATTYQDTTVSASTAYQYRVRAVNATSQGAYATVSTTTTAFPSGGNFAVRAGDPNVVWAHDFASASELETFRYGVRPYTANYPPNLIPYREAVIIGGVPTYAVTYTFLGGQLADPMTISDTTMVLVDGTEFPDPNDPTYPCTPDPSDSMYPTKGYYMWIQATPTGATKGVNREKVYITAKTGANTFTVVRAQDSNLALAWSAGAYIGNECEGNWGRPMSAFPAGQNGKATDDPAASGAVPLRTWNGNYDTYHTTGGFYGAHSADYPASNWDGTEYWLQFRVWIDSGRWAGDNASTSAKIMWLGTVANATPFQEFVLCGDDLKAGNTTGTLFLYTCFNDGRGVASHGQLSDPQGQTGDFQPGAAGDGLDAATCRITGGPWTGCYEWPVDQWVTVMVHFKPGHHNDYDYGDGNSSPVPRGSITVDGTNAPSLSADSKTLTFETNLIPEHSTIAAYKASGTNSNQSAGYFNGWMCRFYDGALSAVTNFTVQSYQVIGGRARWTVTRKSGATISGLPSATNRVGFTWDVPENASRKDSQIQLYVAAQGATSWTTVYDKADFAWVYGTNTKNDFSTNPPGFNLVMPTGYFNASLTQVPTGTFRYRFAEMIFSRSEIPIPA